MKSWIGWRRRKTCRRNSFWMPLPWWLGVALALGTANLQVRAASWQRTNNPQSTNAIRQIVDPSLGYRWEFLPDADHPGGPGRLVRIGPDTITESHSHSKKDDVSRSPSGLGPPTVTEGPLVVHAGETVIVDQNFPTLHARLLAIALRSAHLGESLLVRLQRVDGFAPGSQGGVISTTAAGNKLVRWEPPARSTPE